MQKRLEAYAAEDPDEARFSRVAVQAIVNGILVTNTVLKSAFFAAQLPQLQQRCMVTIFRLQACTKYYWKQLRLDAKATVVFDESLPTDISGGTLPSISCHVSSLHRLLPHLRLSPRFQLLRCFLSFSLPSFRCISCLSLSISLSCSVN